jgi:hypothetical protein
MYRFVYIFLLSIPSPTTNSVGHMPSKAEEANGAKALRLAQSKARARLVAVQNSLDLGFFG